MSADDHKLIADCLNGDTAAFAEVVRRYQDRLYGGVFRLLDSAEDARDVVQETFLQAYRSLDSFKGDALLFTWLYRIAINTAISLKRKRKRMLVRTGLEEGYLTLDPPDPSEYSRPGFALEQAEQGQRVHRALQRLSSEHRIVLVMKELEGQSYEQMSELLQVPIGTIRSRLHRARLELRELLEQDED